jgi:SAM-dependent methyltransferase
MASIDADQLERERADADRRYNEALTALDRAVADTAAPEVSPAAGRETAARLAAALIVFAQQITAFVETKDRQIAAGVAQRLDALAPTAEALVELRTRLSVIGRSVDAFTHGAVAGPESARHAAGAPAGGARPPALSPSDDVTYVGFEDAFRGSDDSIAERLQAYVPLFAGCAGVLDIGCGRGELLAALAAAAVPARGIDTNAAMTAIARQRGLDAVHGDALDHLASLPGGSLGGVIATQVVEHLEPSYLMRLLAEMARTLRPGAPIVLETINPACWLAFFSSYIRDLTHVRPIHPETLQYLLRAAGFERVTIRYSAPVPEAVRMKMIDLPAGTLASSDLTARALVELSRTANANATILNSLLFSYLDYAVVGYRS